MLKFIRSTLVVALLSSVSMMAAAVEIPLADDSLIEHSYLVDLPELTFDETPAPAPLRLSGYLWETRDDNKACEHPAPIEAVAVAWTDINSAPGFVQLE